jgi:hypothetical protein
MNIDIKVEYDSEDLALLIIADVTKRMGDPPIGHRWEARCTYCGCYEAFNVEIQKLEDKKEEASEEVKA